MADLAETVKILKDAGARATFHENGQLKSIFFGASLAPLVIGPDGQPIAEPKPQRTALDVVLGDAPDMETDGEDAMAEAAADYPLEEPDPGEAEKAETRPTEVRDDMPAVVP